VDVRFARHIQIPVGDPQLAQIAIDRFLTLQSGETAPDFMAAAMDGTPIRLADYRGKVVLIDFWATWCAPCVTEMPNLRKIKESLGADGALVVLGVSLDSDRSLVERFVKDRAPWPHIVGGPATENAIAKLFSVEGIPATFLLDHRGVLVGRNLTGEALEQAVRAQVEIARRTAGAGDAPAAAAQAGPPAGSPP
jgi:peroxiredoxin